MAEPSGRPAAPVPIRELPPEVWKQILSNLDEPSLMICRLVNKCLRNLATEVLSESVSFWTTTFQDSVGRRRATHFSTPDEVERFMSEMKEFPNPFPNGALILTLSGRHLSYKEIKDFEAKLSELLKAFEDSIFNLVFSVESCLTYRHLPSILSLKNLKGLVIQSFDWGLDFYGLVNLQLKSLPEKLTELIIHGENGVIPLSYLLRGIQPKSLSSLEISNNSVPFDLCVLCQLPNLKKLKVRYPTAEFLLQFQQFQPDCVAPLKEVSLDLYRYRSPPVLNLLETFALLDNHAESLELLNLNVGFPSSYSRQVTGLNTSVKYKKLKTFSLHNADFSRWPPVMRELMEKLGNLQRFKIAQRFRPEQQTPRDRYDTVMTYWNYLPASVRVISVPDYGWEINRGETLQFNDAGEQVE